MSQLTMIPTHDHPADDESVLHAFALIVAKSQEDRRLVECVERALHATGYGALRGVAVSADGRTVRLAGRVPSYYMKQVAQATALAVPGSRQIMNELNVVQPRRVSD